MAINPVYFDQEENFIPWKTHGTIMKNMIVFIFHQKGGRRG
jgi:hypothetical protein